MHRVVLRRGVWFCALHSLIELLTGYPPHAVRHGFLCIETISHRRFPRVHNPIPTVSLYNGEFASAARARPSWAPLSRNLAVVLEHQRIKAGPLTGYEQSPYSMIHDMVGVLLTAKKTPANREPVGV